MSRFGESLKSLRLENNVHQAVISDLLSVTRGCISSYETNRKEPGFETLIKIADFFNVSTDYILGRSQLKRSHKQFDQLLAKDATLTNAVDKLLISEELQQFLKTIAALSDEKLDKLISIEKIMNG